MKEVFNYAYEMTRISVLSLKPSEKFTVMVSAQGEDKVIEGTGGKDGEEAISAVADISPQGSADMKKTLLAAIEKKPRTIVVFRRSAINDADEIIERAKAEKVAILSVGLTSSESAMETLKKLSDATGGTSAGFGESDLANWAQQAP
jgi:putative aminopeptidase FrvX